MDKLKVICPICQKELKKDDECRFSFDGNIYLVHEKCAHPRKEEERRLERIERALKWIIIRMMDRDMAESYADKIDYDVPDKMSTDELEKYITEGIKKRTAWLDKHLPNIDDFLMKLKEK